jgi:hypothetical protein
MTGGKPGQVTASGAGTASHIGMDDVGDDSRGEVGLQIMTPGKGRYLLMQAFETLTRSDSGWLPWRRPLLNRPRPNGNSTKDVRLEGTCVIR